MCEATGEALQQPPGRLGRAVRAAETRLYGFFYGKTKLHFSQQDQEATQIRCSLPPLPRQAAPVLRGAGQARYAAPRWLGGGEGPGGAMLQRRPAWQPRLIHHLIFIIQLLASVIPEKNVLSLLLATQNINT